MEGEGAVRARSIGVDASAAKGFADSIGKKTRMKHIDVRRDWVKQLRDRSIVEFERIPGTENVADFFTKILDKEDFIRYEDRMMGWLPEELRDQQEQTPREPGEIATGQECNKNEEWLAAPADAVQTES